MSKQHDYSIFEIRQINNPMGLTYIGMTSIDVHRQYQIYREKTQDVLDNPPPEGTLVKPYISVMKKQHRIKVLTSFNSTNATANKKYREVCKQLYENFRNIYGPNSDPTNFYLLKGEDQEWTD